MSDTLLARVSQQVERLQKHSLSEIEVEVTRKRLDWLDTKFPGR